MQNIMIAIDFSDDISSVLTAGLQLAGKFNSKVWLVHVADPDPDFVGYEVGPQYIRDEVAENLREEHRWLDKYKKQFLAMDIETEALLVQGPIVNTLLGELKKLQIDILLLGNHKRNLLHDVFEGSTIHQLMRNAETQLLLIPLKES